MAIPEVTRNETTVIKNNLPDHFLGIKFKRLFGYDLTVVPAIRDKFIMLDPKPVMYIFDENNNELFRFQTSTVFKFKDVLPTENTYHLIYDLIILAVDEFNMEIKKIRSDLSINKKFEKDSFETLYNDINKAFMLNNFN